MLILIKGAGDLATGIACRLHRAGLKIIMTELAVPTTVRRSVAFSRAVYEGVARVEGITGRLAAHPKEALYCVAQGEIPVLVDPDCLVLQEIRFDGLVDAILAKHNTGTHLAQAGIVVAVGPGFTAPIDCHCVVETARGHNLGRTIYKGSAKANTGIPGEIGGYSLERLIKAPCEGIFRPVAEIGDLVTKGQTVAFVEKTPVLSQLDGVLRGLLQEGVAVKAGMKSGDVDPRKEPSYCYSVSDKALAIAGGVLEALLNKGGSL